MRWVGGLWGGEWRQPGWPLALAGRAGSVSSGSLPNSHTPPGLQWTHAHISALANFLQEDFATLARPGKRHWLRAWLLFAWECPHVAVGVRGQVLLGKGRCCKVGAGIFQPLRSAESTPEHLLHCGAYNCRAVLERKEMVIEFMSRV